MIQSVIDIALEAGNAILEVYKQEFTVEIKSDNSPLTVADKNANEIIIAGLKILMVLFL